MASRVYDVRHPGRGDYVGDDCDGAVELVKPRSDNTEWCGGDGGGRGISHANWPPWKLYWCREAVSVSRFCSSRNATDSCSWTDCERACPTNLVWPRVAGDILSRTPVPTHMITVHVGARSTASCRKCVEHQRTY